VKVLLTGGTGYLGRVVTRTLLEAGHEVRLLVRGGPRAGLDERAEVMAGDVTDAAAFRAAAEGRDAILHMAALVKSWVPEREEFDRINLGGVRNAIDAARATGAKLLYTSSFIAVGPTTEEAADESRVHPGHGYRNDYERTKALADVLAREAGDVVILYPGVVYGPGELTDGNIVAKIVQQHLRGQFPGLFGAGDRQWSYAYVDDVAAGHLAALERGRPGERYFLCGDNATMVRFFQVLEEVSGALAPARRIPYGVGKAIGWAMVLWAELTGHPPRLAPGDVDVFREHWAFSSRKAETQLGYRARPLNEGLAETVAWLRREQLA
jgi:farnesol dehydrogenase